jgi:hypothetical protein
MRVTRLNPIFGMFVVAATVFGAEAAIAQNAAAPPSMKTIGTPSAPAKPEIVPSLFVLNSRGATLQGDTLMLTGVTPHSIIFADRPVRSAGHQLTAASSQTGDRATTALQKILPTRPSPFSTRTVRSRTPSWC